MRELAGKLLAPLAGALGGAGLLAAVPVPDISTPTGAILGGLIVFGFKLEARLSAIEKKLSGGK